MERTLHSKRTSEKKLRTRSWKTKESKAGLLRTKPSYPNALSKVHAFRSGVSSNSFQSLMHKLPFSLHDWSEYLHISERSIQRYIQENKTFELPFAERILEIKNLISIGEEVFGDAE